MCVRDEAPAAWRLQRHHRKAAQMCPFVRAERHGEERGFREEARQTFGTRKQNGFVKKEQTSLPRPHSPLTPPTDCPDRLPAASSRANQPDARTLRRWTAAILSPPRVGGVPIFLPNKSR